MPAQWQLPAEDASVLTRAYEERLETVHSPRHRAMLEMLIEHIRCVLAQDVDGVMRTMVAEPAFGMWGPTGDTGSKGYEATRAKYAAVRLGGGIRNQSIAIENFVIDDHTMAVDQTETRLVPAWLATQHGYQVPESEGLYAVHRRCAVFILFDDAGLMRGEINYGYGWPVNPLDWERVADEDVSPEYHVWLKALSSR